MRELGPKRIVVHLVAVLAGIPLVAAWAPAAQAGTGPGDSGVIHTDACSTWQYSTDAGKPIYSGQGTGYRGDTIGGGVVNVSTIDGSWRFGNFYYFDPQGNAHRYNTGWIHVTHIHYIRCW